MRRVYETFFLVLLPLGCASTPMPTQRVAAAQGSIRAADEVGAGKIPAAALHLQLAKEQYDQGNKLVEQGEYERANYVLARAQADAELALALSRNQMMHDEAQKVMEDVQRAQQEGGVVGGP